MPCAKAVRILTILILALPGRSAWGCYAVIVGRAASADGSVLVGHLEQNYGRRVLNFRRVPRQQFPEGATAKLRRGGQLPQVRETWAVLWTQNPGLEFSDAYLNEWGVAVVSDGCPTREDGYEALVRRGEIREGGIGWMLRRLIAQRARSAREGVKIAGDLLERFGYVDSGRTYVIADPREAWLLAVVRGRHWVARRVPDDSVVLLPNVHIIGEVDFNDPANWLASPRLADYAASRGWFDPGAGKPLDFARVYAGARDDHPDPRQWRGRQLVLQREAKWPPSGRLPFAVRPARKLDLAAVMAILRDTKGPAPLSTPLTQEGALFQLRADMPREIGCVYWRATAEPAAGVFTPWYLGITETPPSCCRPVDVTTQLSLPYQFSPPQGTFEFDSQSAWWTFKGLQDAVHEDYSARIKTVERAFSGLESRLLRGQKDAEAEAVALWHRDSEAARKMLTVYCAEQAATARREAEELLARFRGR